MRTASEGHKRFPHFASRDLHDRFTRRTVTVEVLSMATVATMKLAMLLIALLSLAATVAGVHCEDKNPPNDPGFCQREVGKVLDKTR